jgi:hypothetical protein
MRPPGTANLRSFCSANKLTILEKIGLQFILPSESFVTTPGRISISSPNLRTPVRILPPATPPFSSAISAPGLLTSNDRMTMRRGSLVKSRGGIGIRLTIYSLIASILYLSCAEIGIIGADAATVPIHQPITPLTFIPLINFLMD